MSGGTRTLTDTGGPDVRDAVAARGRRPHASAEAEARMTFLDQLARKYLNQDTYPYENDEMSSE